MALFVQTNTIETKWLCDPSSHFTMVGGKEKRPLTITTPSLHYPHGTWQWNMVLYNDLNPTTLYHWNHGLLAVGPYLTRTYNNLGQHLIQTPAPAYKHAWRPGITGCWRPSKPYHPGQAIQPNPAMQPMLHMQPQISMAF